MSDIISTREAAEILGVTQAGVTDLLRRGTINGQKLGREWMVYKDSLLEYKKEREERLANRGEADEEQ